MAIKSETKTLRLTFVDGVNKTSAIPLLRRRQTSTKQPSMQRPTSSSMQNLCDRRRRQPDGLEVQPDRNT